MSLEPSDDRRSYTRERCLAAGADLAPPSPRAGALSASALLGRGRATLHRPGSDLAAGGEAELAEDVRHMGPDRALADREFLADLAVGEATRDQRRHLPLAVTQPPGGLDEGIGARGR